MKILAIETSCDETAVALVECSGTLPEPNFKVLGNALYSQVNIHAEYGGVYPMLAKREHEQNLPLMLERALSEARASVADADLIAVTRGPGLEPALWAGITFAEELGRKWAKPVLAVNHMAGHLWSVLFEGQGPIDFPAVALLVSGGHTELVSVESFAHYAVIGETRDDAVGEAFDKVARLLGLPYPGGAKLAELAEAHRHAGSSKHHFRFPSPMLKTKDYNFSYSGLKTAVLYKVREIGKLDEGVRGAVAAAFENAALEPLVEKTRRAAEEFNARTLIVGGGVSANMRLREMLETVVRETDVDIRFPMRELTGDNAVMIAIAAFVETLVGSKPAEGSITAEGKLPL